MCMCLQVTLDFRKGRDHERWSGRLPEEQKSQTDLWKIDKIWFDSKEDSPSRADSRDRSLQVEMTQDNLDGEEDEPGQGGGPGVEAVGAGAGQQSAWRLARWRGPSSWGRQSGHGLSCPFYCFFADFPKWKITSECLQSSAIIILRKVWVSLNVFSVSLRCWDHRLTCTLELLFMEQVPVYLAVCLGAFL